MQRSFGFLISLVLALRRNKTTLALVVQQVLTYTKAVGHGNNTAASHKELIRRRMMDLCRNSLVGNWFAPQNYLHNDELISRTLEAN